jgi:hypothetical protein
MSNGETPDGFVFPPFIPPSAARTPPPPPPAAPAMPWDAETPVAGDPAPAAAEEAPAEELPWLELPEPREPAAAAAAPVEAEEDGPLPEWMTWDARAEADAEAELAGTPAVEGLEEFDPVASFGVPEAPAAAEDAEEEAFPFGEADTFPYGEPEEEGGEEPSTGEPAGLELEPGYGFDAAADAEGDYPAEAPDEGPGFAPGPLEDPFAAAEPAGASPFVADVEAVLAAEPEPDVAAGETAAESWEPVEADAVEAVEELRGVEEPAEAGAGAPGAFDEVAARLEEIARMLRERPDELLAGRAGDPLALLVTGYVLGYGHGREG